MLDLIKDKLKVEKYIKLMYGKESTLNSITELSARKFAACEKSGLDPTEESVKEMIELKNTSINDKIFSFLQQENPNEYIKLIADQQLYWEIQHRQMEPLKATEDAEEMLKSLNLKTTMSAKSEELLDRINAMYKKIYGGEAEVEMASKQIRLKSPEERLKKMA